MNRSLKKAVALSPAQDITELYRIVRFWKCWSWSQVALVLGVGHVRILAMNCPWIPLWQHDSEAIGDAEMLRSAYWCGAQWCRNGWLDVLDLHPSSSFLNLLWRSFRGQVWRVGQWHVPARCGSWECRDCRKSVWGVCGSPYALLECGPQGSIGQWCKWYAIWSLLGPGSPLICTAPTLEVPDDWLDGSGPVRLLKGPGNRQDV